jgi:hypothetical protein
MRLKRNICLVFYYLPNRPKGRNLVSFEEFACVMGLMYTETEHLRQLGWL